MLTKIVRHPCEVEVVGTVFPQRRLQHECGKVVFHCEISLKRSTLANMQCLSMKFFCLCGGKVNLVRRGLVVLGVAQSPSDTREVEL